MIEVGKYYKSKLSELVIKVIDTHPIYKQRFEAIVVVGIKTKKIGDKIPMAHLAYFEPYKPTPQQLIEWGEIDTQTTQPDPTPNKDVELRLKCLKLAVSRNIDTIFDSEDIVQEAQNYYDWVTQQPLIGKYTSDVKIEIDPKFYKPIN